MGSKKGVSSRDVAREAGVSQATVSYILNNVETVKIRPETREAVLSAIKKLNYHPNQIARGMKLKKSMSVGVVTDRNVTNFYFMKTLEGIRDALMKHNYSITLLFNRSEDHADGEFIEYYSSNRIDGIIFAFASLDDSSLEYMKERNVPFVLVDTLPSGKDVHEVYTDHLNRITEVVSHFVSKGAGKIGYVGPLKSRNDGRVEALRQALERKGVPLDERYIVLCSINDEDMSGSISSLFELSRCPDAVLAGSPRFGFYTLKRALEHGLKVPDELMVTVLGSSNYHNLSHPALSAVEVPLYQMGFEAARVLIELMGGKEVEKKVVLPSELVIRDSS